MTERHYGANVNPPTEVEQFLVDALHGGLMAHFQTNELVEPTPTGPLVHVRTIAEAAAGIILSPQNDRWKIVRDLSGLLEHGDELTQAGYIGSAGRLHASGYYGGGMHDPPVWRRVEAS